jgi:hypothetical protein
VANINDSAASAMIAARFRPLDPYASGRSIFASNSTLDFELDIAISF